MKYKHTAVIFVLMIALSIIISKAYRPVFEVVNTGAEKHILRGEGKDQNKWITDQVNNISYKKNGIEAEYPMLISGGTEEELKQWNQLIEEDFQKILSIYSFNPNKQLTPLPADQIPVYLKIKYKIKRNDSEYISILYTADFNSPYSAHPTELVYTTNIRKPDSRRIRLPDIIKVDQEFIQDFRTWGFLPMTENNEEINKAIKDYVSNISDEELLTGLQASDIIGTGNAWGIFSYLTDDSLGISLGVPNYIGDHVEFEMNYSELKRFLKPEF